MTCVSLTRRHKCRYLQASTRCSTLKDSFLLVTTNNFHPSYSPGKHGIVFFLSHWVSASPGNILDFKNHPGNTFNLLAFLKSSYKNFLTDRYCRHCIDYPSTFAHMIIRKLCIPNSKSSLIYNPDHKYSPGCKLSECLALNNCLCRSPGICRKYPVKSRKSTENLLSWIVDIYRVGQKK